MEIPADHIKDHCALFGRWQVREIHGHSALYTTGLGSYLRMRVDVPGTITVNALNNGNPHSNPQIYAWRINKQSWHRVAVTEMPMHIIIKKATNLEIMTAGNNDADQVWTGDQGFAIQSIVTGEGAQISKPKSRPLIAAVGDSITAGCWVAGKNSSYDYRPESNYLQLTADACGFDVDRIAYSASGILAPGTGGVPAVNEWLDHLDQQTSWLPRHYRLVIVNLGTNDHQPDPTAFTTRMLALLNNIKQQWQAPVLVLTPLSQRNDALIAQATLQSSCQLVKTHDWCHHFTDHTHPNQAGSTEIAQYLTAVIKQLKGASADGK